MRHTYDKATAERRVNAYAAFLMEAYGNDRAALAEAAGVDRVKLSRFLNSPYKDKSTITLILLARLTGVSLAWLFAEEPADDAEGVA